MNRAAISALIGEITPARRVGYVQRASPGRVDASGPFAAVGDTCEIHTESGGVLAEVAAVADAHIVLAPLDAAVAIRPGLEVVAKPSRALAPVGVDFSGRLVDAFGEALDGAPTPRADAMTPLHGEVMAPLERSENVAVLETGIRAIDGILTLGRGQRVGLFAASGVGKTTLVAQLALGVSCDRCVLCLVGERGHEVAALWRAVSTRPDKQRFTAVAATSDAGAPVRARCLNQALALAEHWRASGEHVLLIVDSVTRFAMALREMGLAAGAPPTLRAYTPNVFAALPRAVERCGAASSGGAITAIMTVLSETDDVDDPIVEVMKSLLDGHIVLSRQLAEQGCYPAIDVLRSVSRQSSQLMSPDHAAAARRVLSLMATYEDARVMVESGIYKAGASRTVDDAVCARDGLRAFLRQEAARTPFAETTGQLIKLAGSAHA